MIELEIVSSAKRFGNGEPRPRRLELKAALPPVRTSDRFCLGRVVPGATLVVLAQEQPVVGLVIGLEVVSSDHSELVPNSPLFGRMSPPFSMKPIFQPKPRLSLCWPPDCGRVDAHAALLDFVVDADRGIAHHAQAGCREPAQGKTRPGSDKPGAVAVHVGRSGRPGGHTLEIPDRRVAPAPRFGLSILDAIPRFHCQ